MKKLTLLLALACIIQATAISQSCLPDGITFTTQEQIDNFKTNYPNCTEIEGKVEIYGDDIINLDSLNNVIHVGGTLQIGNNNGMIGANPVLISLLGLSNLTTVGGDLKILGNDSLVDLHGFESLSSIVGSLEIGGWWNTWPCANLSLLNLDGLENLAFVGDHIMILGGGIFGYGVEDISALSNLTSINGDVTIRYVPFLQSLDGFNNIYSIGGNLILSDLGLISLSGLDNLSYLAGEFVIDGNDSLISLSGLTLLDSVGGGLSIYTNNRLDNLSGLENITSIGGGLYVASNDTLTSLTGLENIDAASILSLKIRNNKLLSNCEVQSICDYLKSPNSTAEIYYNAPGCNSQEEVEMACDSASFVREPIFLTEISIWPNPFTGNTTIEYELLRISEIQITIYNHLGKQVEVIERTLSQGKQQILWNAEGLPPGIYFCVLKTESGTQTMKMIKL